MPQVVVISFAVILFVLIINPIALVYVYFTVRPLVHEFSLDNLTLFSLPINWPIAAAVILSAFPFGIFRRNFRYFPPNSLAIYSLVFLSIVSAAYSINTVSSLSQSAKFLNALALVLVALSAASSRQGVIRIYQGILVSSVIPMAYGYYQGMLGLSKWDGSLLRITSFFGFPNMYGIFLSLILFVGFILYLDSDRKYLKILYGTILASAVASTIIARNRGSWIAIVLSVLLAAPFYRKYISVKWIMIVFVVLGVAASDIIIDRFMDLQADRAGADTFRGRLHIWELVAANFSEISPLGFGAGTAQEVMNNLFRIDNLPHNDYIRLLLELGYLGPLIYMWLLVREGLWNLRVRRNPEGWYINYFTLVMICYMTIISTVQNVIHNVIVFPIFLVCCHLARRYVTLKAEAQS